MPNPWDRGIAKLMAARGALALATRRLMDDTPGAMRGGGRFAPLRPP